MNLIEILHNLRFQDVLDILFLSMVVYHFYLWFWGTKAFKALVGLLALGIVFTLARTWGLFLTTWVFQIFWQVLVIFLIILFQKEIRQLLEKVNPLKMIGLKVVTRKADWVEGFTKTIFAFARQKTGALIIFERRDLVEEHITQGVQLESTPSPEILNNVFQKHSQLHDGAMLIHEGQVAMVSCYLPLSTRESLPQQYGTRHRAALGLSERCDAWVLVVSEETGKVCLARGSQITAVDTPTDLVPLVQEAISPSRSEELKHMEILRDWLTRRVHLKLATVALVSIFWLLLAGQQNFEVTVAVPLQLQNLSNRFQLAEPSTPEIEVTVRGLRRDASTITNKNVLAAIDLSSAAPGTRTFQIARHAILLPNDRTSVVKIERSQIELSFIEKPKLN